MSVKINTRLLKSLTGDEKDSVKRIVDYGQNNYSITVDNLVPILGRSEAHIRNVLRLMLHSNVLINPLGAEGGYYRLNALDDSQIREIQKL